MARFDVHVNRGADGWLLDVQADLFGGLNTRLVVPLLPVGSAPTSAERLNRVLDLPGERVSMLTQFMAAVPLAELGRPVTSLDHESDAIFAAIDCVHHGW
ncbi:MAG TPA: CcdB family protein [Rubrivivax sp.]|nr:CcdB family protein [Rubrivivax sp.]